jgi:aspartate ammonia-lyase
MGTKEVELPKKQTGSSIMPGKVNPVIPEYVISCCHKIYANDQLISSLSAQGCLDLNAYLPVIGDAVLNSLELLIVCNITIKDNIFNEVEVFPDKALSRLLKSPSITTALVPVIGYNRASEMARLMKEKDLDIYEANEKLLLVERQKMESLLSVENLLNLGFRVQDYM